MRRQPIDGGVLQECFDVSRAQIEAALEVLRLAAGAGQGSTATVREIWESYSVAKAPARFAPPCPTTAATKRTRVGERSWPSIKSRTRPVLEHFGSRPLALITPEEVEDYVAMRMQTPRRTRGAGFVSQNSASQEAIMLLCLAKWAMQRGLIGTSKIRGMDLRGESSGPKRVYTPQEIDAILDACRRCNLRELFAIVTIMRGNGVRPVELLRLKWVNIDLDRGLVYFTKNMVKNRRPRTMALLREGVEALRGLGPGEPNDWVFPGRQTAGRPRSHLSLSTIDDQWGKARDVAMIAPNDDGSAPILYAMKHTLATKLARQMKFGEYELDAAMGWVPGSREAKTYVQDTVQDALEMARRIEAAEIILRKQRRPTDKPSEDVSREHSKPAQDDPFDDPWED